MPNSQAKILILIKMVLVEQSMMTKFHLYEMQICQAVGDCLWYQDYLFPLGELKMLHYRWTAYTQIGHNNQNQQG